MEKYLISEEWPGVSAGELSMIDDHLYSAILRSLEQTHCARLWFYMNDKLFFYSALFEYPPKWCT